MSTRSFSLARLGCRWLLGAAGLRSPRLSVVLFHRVLAAPDPVLEAEPDVERFEQQIRWLAGAFDILPVREAAARLVDGALPRRALCITFDDGYRDNAEYALPVLAAAGVPATFFVTTRYRDGGMMWNDRVVEAVRAWREPEIDLEADGLGRFPVDAARGRTLERVLRALKYEPFERREALASKLLEASGAAPVRLMMNDEEIRRLHAAGMEIGGHTESHPILASLSREEAHAEIAGNKAALESVIGEPLVTFAYPNGRPGEDYDARHLELLRECGYRYAFTTSPGTAAHGCDRLQLPRFTPWDRSEGRYLAHMVQNYFRAPVTVAD